MSIKRQEREAEIEELQRSLSNLVTETTQHRTEMQKNAETWQAVELAKRDKVISDLSSLVEAKDEATAQLNDEFTVHVEELVCHNNPGKCRLTLTLTLTLATLTLTLTLTQVSTKVELAEAQSRNDELRRDLTRTRQKLSAAAARYTKLEAMYASEKDARGKKK